MLRVEYKYKNDDTGPDRGGLNPSKNTQMHELYDNTCSYSRRGGVKSQVNLVDQLNS